ncbi:hypothetical protein KY362_01160, partial [Candidatus Woesearchaeota archaeon]|nr:hypothetical protein [Candidatus Woesearchaeota archaeon]
MSVENRLNGMSIASNAEMGGELTTYLIRKSVEVEQARNRKELSHLVRRWRGETDKPKDHTAGLLFTQNSTRTRMSSSRAARYMGMEPLEIAGPEGTSLKKGESLLHTAVTLIENDAEILYVRDSLDGCCKWLIKALQDMAREGVIPRAVPVINCGDGRRGHPTQGLLNERTMLNFLGRMTDECEHPYSLAGQRILMGRDLAFGRVPRSDAEILSRHGVHFDLVATETFQLPEAWRDIIEMNGSTYEMHDKLSPELVALADIVCMYRIQDEMLFMVEPEEIEEAVRNTTLRGEHLRDAKPHLKVMHPLP